MNDDAWVIKIQNASKTFRVHREKNPTLKEKLLYARRAKYREFVALEDVSFTVDKGMTVGLLGVNGSGKSTLLKLISRILYPDEGTVRVRGKVSSLLELGAGFHPDFTGYENIFLNGSLMGLSKKELLNKVDEIVEFSELGDFIQEPIRSYSSGMYMRLAFSVAVAVDPEILLIDEILAVGDTAFQAKCMERLRYLQKQNKTIVMVTHDTGVVERFCDRAVWLHNSKLVLDGEPVDTVQRYLQQAFHNAAEGSGVMSFDRNNVKSSSEQSSEGATSDESHGRIGSHELSFKSVNIESPSGSKVVEAGQSFDVVLNVHCDDPRTGVVYSVGIESEDGTLLYQTDTKTDLADSLELSTGDHVQVRLALEKIPLSQGVYYVTARILTEEGQPIDFWSHCAQFTVIGSTRGTGYIQINHRWDLESKEA